MQRPRKRTVLFFLLIACGLYCAGLALWHMGRTAMFVHESVVVTATVKDWNKRSFESTREALSYGNLPWDGDTAYRPIVTFTIPRDPAPIDIYPPIPVNDWDNREYSKGEEVEVILPPTLPEQVHLYRFKSLWGGDCLLLLLGAALGAGGYLPLRRCKHRKPQASRPKVREPKHETPAPAPAPSRPKRQSAPARPKRQPRPQEDEEPFRLESGPAPKKKRTRKPKDPDAPAKPRKPRKKKTE